MADTGSFDHFYYGELTNSGPGGDVGSFNYFYYGNLPAGGEPGAPAAGPADPLYKTAPIASTVDATDGRAIRVSMILDE